MDFIVTKNNNNINEIVDFLTDESFKLYSDIKKFYMLDENIISKIKKEFKDHYKKTVEESTVYTAYIDDILVGCACINKNNYLSNLFVSEKYQNQGIGTKLLQEVLNDNKNNDITGDANPKYVEFYKKNSFEVIGKGQYSVKMKKFR